MAFTLPPKGFVFWPVGTGDSSTIVVKNKSVIIQFDLHHMEKSKEKEDPTWPIVDELVKVLPKKNNRPYLSVFVLSHPDQDHIKGFGELLNKVTIGEIWHTPRIYSEYKTELCDDAKAFKKEAERRTEKTIEVQGKTDSGDRVRIIGHDDIFQEGEMTKFPAEWRTLPGRSITQIDGTDYSSEFNAFVHAPFKDDFAATRNNTSLSLHITLAEGAGIGKALFFGDREYPTIKQIFEITKERKREQFLQWNVMLSSHHCSKSVMYERAEGESEEKLKKDILSDFEEFAQPSAVVVSSCNSDFSDDPGKNPPHLKARKRYEEVVDAGCFICTHEYPNVKAPVPVVFEIDATGIKLRSDVEKAVNSGDSLGAAIKQARGGDAPPTSQVGFG